MSFKLRETADVFAALESLCANGYRMYDPQERRSYYDHDCDVYNHALWDAEDEYQRLLEHCMHQRDELAKASNQSVDRLLDHLRKEYNIVASRRGDIWTTCKWEGKGTEEQMSITDELRSIIGYFESRLSRLEGLHEGSMKGIEAHLADLESRVERIERLLKHDGA